QVAEHEAERQRDRERDAHRDGGQLELLHDLRPDQMRVLADEPQGVGEGAGLERVCDDHRTFPLRARGRSRAGPGFFLACAVTLLRFSRFIERTWPTASGPAGR